MRGTMKGLRLLGAAALAVTALSVAGCNNQSDPNVNVFTGEEETGSSVFDIFANNPDANVTLEVNRYIWSATLEVLNFMPLESADPFSGILVFGYGTPPGGSRSYRATVHVKDPALDARSLNLSLNTRSGPAAAETTRAVEAAILTRARQLRIAENDL